MTSPSKAAEVVKANTNGAVAWPERWLDLVEVREVTRLGKTTIYRLMSMGDFPRPKKVGRASRWRGREVAKWMDE